MKTLCNGDWEGDSAEVFYAEMDSVVMPALGRLVAALDDAAQTTLGIREVMAQAELDVAAIFRERDVGGAGKGKGLASGAAPQPPWDADGFGWWAEAFAKEHGGRMPTQADYDEFRLSWAYSGNGQVQWTSEDWKAFYEARQKGLDDLVKQGIRFEGAWTGKQLLDAVDALMANPQPSGFTVYPGYGAKPAPTATSAPTETPTPQPSSTPPFWPTVPPSSLHSQHGDDFKENGKYGNIGNDNGCGPVALSAAAEALGLSGYDQSMLTINGLVEKTENKYGFGKGTGIQPKEYAQMARDMFPNAKIETPSYTNPQEALQRVKQELQKGNQVIVDFLSDDQLTARPYPKTGNLYSTDSFAHFARIVGFSQDGQKIFLAQSMNPINSNDVIEAPTLDFIQSWQNPEKRAKMGSNPNVKTEEVYNWMMVISR